LSYVVPLKRKSFSGPLASRIQLLPQLTSALST
jgi:hypothetical protein